MDKKETLHKKKIPDHLYLAWKKTAQSVGEQYQQGDPTVPYQLDKQLEHVIFDMSEGALLLRGLTDYIVQYLSLIISRGFIPHIVNRRGDLHQPESMDEFNTFLLNFIEEAYQPQQKKNNRLRK